MIKSIEKTCTITEDTVIIKLEDTRDAYVNKNALGEIGEIYISKEGLLIYPHFDPDEKITTLRNKQLFQAFGEIFEVTDYNPLSSEYYNKINVMIEDGTLQFLGYTIETDKIDYLFENIDRNQPRRH